MFITAMRPLPVFISGSTLISLEVSLVRSGLMHMFSILWLQIWGKYFLKDYLLTVRARGSWCEPNDYDCYLHPRLHFCKRYRSDFLEIKTIIKIQTVGILLFSSCD